MQTIVTIKGQVTIPTAVRERAGLRPGDRVEVTNDQTGKVVLNRVDGQEADAAERQRRRDDMLARIDRLAGVDRTGEATDDFMARIREPVPL